MNTKDIKVYGTLVNHTVDNSIGDGSLHNDKLAVARQLYDDQFGDPTPVNNFQDVINKRVKNISAGAGTTTVAGDLVVTGDIIINGQRFNPADILSRLAALEAIWKIQDGYIVPASNVDQVKAAAYFDTSVN